MQPFRAAPAGTRVVGHALDLFGGPLLRETAINDAQGLKRRICVKSDHRVVSFFQELPCKFFHERDGRTFKCTAFTGRLTGPCKKLAEGSVKFSKSCVSHESKPVSYTHLTLPTNREV